MNTFVDEDAAWMQLALAQAHQAEAAGEVPVGAVVVKGGRLLAAGHNLSISSCDPTAHAEVVALRAAAQAVGNYRLDGCTLYVTLEPCAMCSGAMLHARLDRVVFGAHDPRAGAAGSVLNLFAQPGLNHHTVVHAGVQAVECAHVLHNFFKPRRVNRNPLREDALRTPEHRFAALPDWPWPMQRWTDLPVLDGLHLSGVDQSPEVCNSPHCVLCLHPVEGWGYTFRHLIPALLSSGVRVAVPDLVGFGRSDKPKKQSFHSVDWHAKVLHAWMVQLQLANVICVLPSQAGVAQIGCRLMSMAPELFQAIVWLDEPSGHAPNTRAKPSTVQKAAYDAPFPDKGFRAAQRAFGSWPAVEDAALNLSGIIQIHFPLVALESKSDSRALADAVINCVSAGKPSP